MPIEPIRPANINQAAKKVQTVARKAGESLTPATKGRDEAAYAKWVREFYANFFHSKGKKAPRVAHQGD